MASFPGKPKCVKAPSIKEDIFWGSLWCDFELKTERKNRLNCESGRGLGMKCHYFLVKRFTTSKWRNIKMNYYTIWKFKSPMDPSIHSIHPSIIKQNFPTNGRTLQVVYVICKSPTQDGHISELKWLTPPTILQTQIIWFYYPFIITALTRILPQEQKRCAHMVTNRVWVIKHLPMSLVPCTTTLHSCMPVWVYLN